MPPSIVFPRNPVKICSSKFLSLAPGNLSKQCKIGPRLCRKLGQTPATKIRLSKWNCTPPPNKYMLLVVFALSAEARVFQKRLGRRRKQETFFDGMLGGTRF